MEAQKEGEWRMLKGSTGIPHTVTHDECPASPVFSAHQILSHHVPSMSVRFLFLSNLSKSLFRAILRNKIEDYRRE